VQATNFPFAIVRTFFNYLHYFSIIYEMLGKAIFLYIKMINDSYMFVRQLFVIFTGVYPQLIGVTVKGQSHETFYFLTSNFLKSVPSMWRLMIFISKFCLV
jgi:hypothetical protein